ncbi:MAG: hypothetical protein BGO49_05845 [Planctomycetales bacterium 71-10]|nr:MAG: hypothetical protein BGO49_05845 [Planctomycetales bacterium 71-10]
MLRRIQFYAFLALIFPAAVGWDAVRADIIYDAVNDFSVAANPGVDGVWSYGAGVGSSFTLLSTSNMQELGVDGLWSWRGAVSGSGGLFPVIMANKTGGVATAGELPAFPTDLLFLHPSPAGTNEEATLRWTAPNAGVFLIEGHFEGLQSDNGSTPTTDVRIVLNGSEVLFSGSINSLYVPLTFSISQSFAAGDILDFAIGDGGNGNGKDGTGLAAIVTRAVPEAPSVLLIAMGFLGVGLRAARQGTV